MKIIKYIVIILLLSVVFFTVYIATGKSSYELNVSKSTELSTQRLFRYANNLQNFSEWNPWDNNADAFETDSIFSGKGAKTRWQSNEVTILKALPNDTIFLKIHAKGNDFNTKMYFQQTEGKTTIHWKVDGRLSLSEKFQLFFQGTPETLIAPVFEKGLNNINHFLSERLKNYSIKNENLEAIHQTYYIKQIVESDIESLGEKIFQSMEHMNDFAKNFELEPQGAPFTMFENISLLSGNVKYAVCLPVKNFFNTAEGSDIICEELPAFSGYKVILTGDYIHSDKAWEEAKKQVHLKHLTARADIKPIAIYKNSILTTQKSDEWITEFIIPVNETFIPIIETPADSLEVIN